MRIGIITYWTSQDNYGQLLQCFALQRFLRDRGHDAFLIRYTGKPPYKSSVKLGKALEYIRHFGAYVRYARDLMNRKRYESAMQTSRKFDDFIAVNIKTSEQTYDYNTLFSDVPHADAYICGSDQIWGGGDDVYYLSFAPSDKIKIAYAPSFGGVSEFSHERAIQIKTLLSDFRLITTREQSGVATLRRLGIEGATRVVDPTLLLPKEVYESLCDKDLPPKDAFVYLLGNPVVCRTGEIFSFLNTRGMSCHYVASQGRVDGYDKLMATIPQWLSGIRHSKLVITNSFHCVVFSLLFSRPFIFVPLSGEYARMNNRLEELLAQCGLETQIYNGNFKNIPLEIDTERFSAWRRDQSAMAEKLLLGALRNG